MSSTDRFKVLAATDKQRTRLRQIADRSYEKGLMDTLYVFMTPEQLRTAHEDEVLSHVIRNQVESDLSGVTSPAEVLRPSAVIRPA